MAKIQDLLKHYSKIVDILFHAGAQKVLMFKGFAPKEKHSLNILIMEYQAEKQDHPICRANIIDALTQLLGCTVCTTDKQLMLSEFYEQLNLSNSFELPLSNTPENMSQLQGSLQRIFGPEWEFVIREPYDKEATEEEERRYHEEMESMRPWFEQHEREIDEQGASITPKSKGGGFFPQQIAQDSTATIQITFVCGGVTTTRTLFLHNASFTVMLKSDLPDKLARACSDLLQREGLQPPTSTSETVCRSNN